MFENASLNSFQRIGVDVLLRFRKLFAGIFIRKWQLLGVIFKLPDHFGRKNWRNQPDGGGGIAAGKGTRRAAGIFYGLSHPSSSKIQNTDAVVSLNKPPSNQNSTNIANAPPRQVARSDE